MSYRRLMQDAPQGPIVQAALRYILAVVNEKTGDQKTLIESYRDKDELDVFVRELGTLTADYMAYMIALDGVIHDIGQSHPEQADQLRAAHIEYFGDLEGDHTLLKEHIKHRITMAGRDEDDPSS